MRGIRGAHVRISSRRQQKEKAFGGSQQQNNPKPQVGMASGRSRRRPWSLFKQQMCGESLTLPLPHCHYICPRSSLRCLSPLLGETINKRKGLSLNLLIGPRCPHCRHLMTSGSHYWKTIVFVISPPLSLDIWEFSSWCVKFWVCFRE